MLSYRPGLSALGAKKSHQLPALPFGEAADSLVGADAAVVQHLGGFDLATIRHGQQYIDDLGGLDELRRSRQDLVDLDVALFQVLLEPRALGADVVSPP